MRPQQLTAYRKYDALNVPKEIKKRVVKHFTGKLPYFLGMTDDECKTAIEVVTNFNDHLREFGRQTGRCGMCGRELTNPDSVALGIGPECATKL